MLAPSLSTANLQDRLGTPSTPLAAHGWQLTKLASGTDEEKLELDKEIQRLERVLNVEVDEWQRRLDDVNAELRGGGK